MRQRSVLISLTVTAVLLSVDVLAQEQVQIQFQKDPVLVQTGTEIVFTLLTVSQVLSITWKYKGDITLGVWSGGNPSIDLVPQFEGRITITATQLRIGGAQLRDAGNYSVTVIPTFSTGQVQNSRSVQLRVFDAVAGVSLFVPSVAVESKNVSLRCRWTAGTETSVQWGKDDEVVTADSRITISADGSLIMDPSRRADAGEYTCTVSNLVSAQTATQSLTVYYGPDTPVLTKDSPKDCVGVGDVLVGQTIRLTCSSDSLPPALFSWQRDGQTVTSGQPGSGVLSLQTLSTDESGRYLCTARNSITGGSSEQDTLLSVVDTCLSGGEVAGIVIGAFLLLVIIALLIALIVFLVRRRREHWRQRETVYVHKTNPDPVPPPPEPRPNGVRALGHRPDPPLHHSDTHTHTRQPGHFYSAPHETRGNGQTLWLNGLHSSHTNGRLHNGVDNPAFTHTEAVTANTQPQQNILIHPGTAQAGNQQPTLSPALQLSLNTQPNNNTAQLPTIHVNLNSFSSSAPQTQQDTSLPLNNAVSNSNNAVQTQTNPRMQSGHFVPNDKADAGPIPTTFTHINSNVTLQNADTQTYEEDAAHQLRRSNIRDSAHSSAHRQMPWDRLRGTPSYPSGSLQRRPPSPELIYNSTDYTTHPPLREGRTISRADHRPQRQDATATRSRSADHRGPNNSIEALVGTLHDRMRSSREPGRQPVARQDARQDMRQDATHRHAPSEQQPSPPHMSQQASAVSAGLRGTHGSDSRALADPNHLLQAHMSQPIHNQPQAPAVHTRPAVTNTRQTGAAPLPVHSHPSHLTRAAVQAHTERARTFQSRRQQTQAVLLSPGPQTRTPAADAPHAPAPPPPPIIPLSQFQTLPKERSQHRSPARAPQAPRPPVNIPLSQRNLHIQQQRHPVAVPTNRKQHHPEHVHVSPHRTAHHGHHGHHTHHTHHTHHAHGRGHGNPAHFTNPGQTHRRKPR